jgi:hypothetical protein
LSHLETGRTHEGVRHGRVTIRHVRAPLESIAIRGHPTLQ